MGDYGFFTHSVSAAYFYGNGINIFPLDAASIFAVTGPLDPSTIPPLNASNAFGAGVIPITFLPTNTLTHFGTNVIVEVTGAAGINIQSVTNAFGIHLTVSAPSLLAIDGNGGGLTNLSATAITGGFSTNIVIGGHTFYYTNGVLMNVQ